MLGLEGERGRKPRGGTTSGGGGSSGGSGSSPDPTRCAAACAVQGEAPPTPTLPYPALNGRRASHSAATCAKPRHRSKAPCACRTPSDCDTRLRDASCTGAAHVAGLHAAHGRTPASESAPRLRTAARRMMRARRPRAGGGAPARTTPAAPAPARPRAAWPARAWRSASPAARMGPHVSLVQHITRPQPQAARW